MLRPSLSLLVVVLSACPQAPPPAPPEPPPAPSVTAAAPPGREDLIHSPLRHEVARHALKYTADWSFDLLVTPGWSAHAHVIPSGQLIPLHHHAQGEELVWMAGGTASWQSLARGELNRSGLFEDLGADSLVWSPAGVAHGVRNRGELPLVAVVLSRPPFAQNWYLLPGEVESERRSTVILPSAPLPEGIYPGWTLRWLSPEDVATPRPGTAADLLYFVGEASGSLRFEDKELPIEPSLFIRVPPGLAHTLVVGPDQAKRVLEIRVPREPTVNPGADSATIH